MDLIINYVSEPSEYEITGYINQDIDADCVTVYADNNFAYYLESEISLDYIRYWDDYYFTVSENNSIINFEKAPEYYDYDFAFLKNVWTDDEFIYFTFISDDGEETTLKDYSEKYDLDYIFENCETVVAYNTTRYSGISIIFDIGYEDDMIYNEAENAFYYYEYDEDPLYLSDETKIFNTSSLKETGKNSSPEDGFIYEAKVLAFDRYGNIRAIEIKPSAINYYANVAFYSGAFADWEWTSKDNKYFNGKKCFTTTFAYVGKYFEDAVFDCDGFTVNGVYSTDLSALNNFKGILEYTENEYGLITSVKTLTPTRKTEIYEYYNETMHSKNGNDIFVSDSISIIGANEEDDFTTYNTYKKAWLTNNNYYKLSKYETSDGKEVIWIEDEGDGSGLISSYFSAEIIPEIEKIALNINYYKNMSEYIIGTAYAALYKDNKLEQVKSFNLDLNSSKRLYFDFDGNVNYFNNNDYMIKLFGWDSNMNPIAEKKEIDSLYSGSSSGGYISRSAETSGKVVMFNNNAKNYVKLRLYIDGHRYTAILEKEYANSLMAEYSGQTISDMWYIEYANDFEITMLEGNCYDEAYSEYHTITFPTDITEYENSFWLENETDEYVLDRNISTPEMGEDIIVEYIQYPDYRLVKYWVPYTEESDEEKEISGMVSENYDNYDESYFKLSGDNYYYYLDEGLDLPNVGNEVVITYIQYTKYRLVVDWTYSY